MIFLEYFIACVEWNTAAAPRKLVMSVGCVLPVGKGGNSAKSVTGVVQTGTRENSRIRLTTKRELIEAPGAVLLTRRWPNINPTLI